MKTVRLAIYLAGMLVPVACGALFLSAWAGFVDETWRYPALIGYGAWIIGWSVGAWQGSPRTPLPKTE